MDEALKGISVNELTQEERLKYSIYVKLGRYQVLAELDSGAQITTISEPLAKKLELKWEPMDTKLTLIAANGGRNQALGVIKDANLRIKDVKVPINIYVRESSEESLLIGATWFKRYEADMMLSANRLLFVAQKRKFETKIYEGNPKDVSINTWTVEEEDAPPPYQPTIVISDEEADNEEEDNWDPMTGLSVQWTINEQGNTYLTDVTDSSDESYTQEELSTINLILIEHEDISYEEDDPEDIVEHNHVYRGWRWPCKWCDQADHHTCYYNKKTKRRVYPRNFIIPPPPARTDLWTVEKATKKIDEMIEKLGKWRKEINEGNDLQEKVLGYEQILGTEAEVEEMIEIPIDITPTTETKAAYLASLDLIQEEIITTFSQVIDEGQLVAEILEEYADIISKGPHDIGNCTAVEHAIRLFNY